MNEAETARTNAISLECKKDGLQQRQSGDWLLRFVVSATDMDGRISQAPMGTRYQCVLVEVADDETPVDHKAQDRDKWRALGARKQAVLRCKDPVFWSYLREWLHYDVHGEDIAATTIRDLLGVQSRSELDKPLHTEARLRWYKLDQNFQAWKVKEHAG